MNLRDSRRSEDRGADDEVLGGEGVNLAKSRSAKDRRAHDEALGGEGVNLTYGGGAEDRTADNKVIGCQGVRASPAHVEIQYRPLFNDQAAEHGVGAVSENGYFGGGEGAVVQQ